MTRRIVEIWGKEKIARCELEDVRSAANSVSIRIDDIEAELSFHAPDQRAERTMGPDELIADSRVGLEAMAAENPSRFEFEDEPRFGASLAERSAVRLRIEQDGRRSSVIVVAGRNEAGNVLRVSALGPDDAVVSWQDLARMLEFAAASDDIKAKPEDWTLYRVYGHSIALPDRVRPPVHQRFDLVPRPPCWGIDCDVRLLGSAEAATALDEDAERVRETLRERMEAGATVAEIPDRRVAWDDKSLVMRGRAFFPPTDDAANEVESDSNQVWLQWFAIVRDADGWGVAFELGGDVERGSYGEGVLYQYEDWLLQVGRTVSVRDRRQEER